MLFDDDYNTYEEETPFVTVEAASEQLLTGVLSNIHEFEMGLVLEEYQYLAEHGRQAVFHGEWFEHLEDELYSMRFNGISRLGNLRIIYCFYGKYIVLLVPFLEQGSKTYDEGKRTARARLKLIKEGKVVWNS